MSTNASLSLFLTGGGTSLGRESTRQLVARGHHVMGLTEGSESGNRFRKDGGLPAYSDPFRAGELKGLMQTVQADVAVHLLTQVPNGFPHREASWQANERALTAGVQAVAEAAKSSGAKFLVYLSYVTVYGDTHGGWVTEDSPLHTPSALKAAVEAEQQVLNSGIPACVLRAGTLYSSGDEGSLALGDTLRRGRGLYLGNGHNYQNWIYVADLARAIVLAAEQQPVGQIFNIVDDQPATPIDFATHLAAGLGLDQPRAMPAFTVSMMTSAMQRLLIDSSIRAKNDKAKQILGWSPKYPDYKAGMEQMLLGWRAGEAV